MMLKRTFSSPLELLEEMLRVTFSLTSIDIGGVRLRTRVAHCHAAEQGAFRPCFRWLPHLTRDPEDPGAALEKENST